MKPQAAHLPPDLPADDPAVWLSALADGDGGAADRACAHWRDDPQARRTWHAYQLIGDVMRSEDLAEPAAHDAAFLQGLRARLAAEPVVLAPAPAAPPVRRRQPWLVPVAAAAGFVVVAGVLVVTRVSQPEVQGGSLIVSGPAAAPKTVVAGDPVISNKAQPVMLRDPRLEEFERAHRLVRGGLVVSAPAGSVRPVDMTVPAAATR